MEKLTILLNIGICRTFLGKRLDQKTFLGKRLDQKTFLGKRLVKNFSK